MSLVSVMSSREGEWTRDRDGEQERGSKRGGGVEREAEWKRDREGEGDREAEWKRDREGE